MLGCCMGCGAGAAGVGDVTDRDGDVGEGDVGLAGAEYDLEPRLPDEERPPPARAKTSSGIRKQRKKNNVKSISPFNTQRFVVITPPVLVYLLFRLFVFLVKKRQQSAHLLKQIKHRWRFLQCPGDTFSISSAIYV
jgi:hypothetical protein